MKPKRTILCVDDNEQSLSYRKIMLETRGYRVASYSRGADALERFKQGGIDLVVTDMAMPGMDGPQLIAAIKTLSPHVPAILISSKVRVYDHDPRLDPSGGSTVGVQTLGHQPEVAGLRGAPGRNLECRCEAPADGPSTSCGSEGTLWDLRSSGCGMPFPH